MKNTLIKANLAIFFAELFNALNVNAQKYLLPEWCSPFAMLLIRVTFGCMLFWVISFFICEKKVPLKDILFMVTLGALSLTSYITFYLLGVMKSSPIDSSLIMSTMPIVVLIMALILFQEHLSKLKSLGMFLGLCGTVLVILIQRKSGGSVDTVLGNLFCLLSSISYAFYMLINKRFAGQYAASTILKWMFTGAMILSIPLAFIFGWETPFIAYSGSVVPWMVVLFVLVFPTGLTYFLIPFALKHLQASSVAMYDYEVPIVASFVGVMLGQAHFNWYQLVATVLIFGGVYLVSKENRRMKDILPEPSEK